MQKRFTPSLVLPRMRGDQRGLKEVLSSIPAPELLVQVNRPRSELCRVFRRDVLQSLESVRDRDDPRRTTEPPKGITSTSVVFVAAVRIRRSHSRIRTPGIDIDVDPPVNKGLLFVELVGFVVLVLNSERRGEVTMRARAATGPARAR